MPTDFGLDRYTLLARYRPFVLVVVPVIATVLLGIPSFERTTSKVVAVLVAIGAPFVAVLTRHAGRRLQPSLYAKWGGRPTQGACFGERLSGTDAEAERLRQQLRRVVGPSPAVPAADAVTGTGDDVLRVITGVLIARTRSRTDFPTVFDGNVQYGFWRNCLGARPVALTISIAATAAAVVLAVLTAHHHVHGGTGGWIAAAVLDLITAGLWAAVNSSRVRLAGDRYAEALLAAVESAASAEASA